MRKFRLSVMAVFTVCLMLVQLKLLAFELPDQLSEEDKQIILDKINEFRSQVALGLLDDANGNPVPTATNMNKLVWDDALALVATQYAAQKIWGHNSNRQSDLGDNFELASFSQLGYVGENIYVASSTSVPTINTLLNGFDAWESEVADWVYSTSTNGDCEPNSACGHFTQDAWAKTRYIGCGFIRADEIQNLNFNWPSTYLVCNYFPGGNYIGQPVYLSGEIASACEADRTPNIETGLCEGGLAYDFVELGNTTVTQCDDSVGRYICDETSTLDSDNDGYSDYIEFQFSTDKNNILDFPKCSIGRFYLDGVCEEAPAGSFVEIEGALEATLCPAGKYQPNPGMQSCILTEKGKYSEAGAEVSIACMVGTYQPIEGQGACEIASAGNYVSIQGAIEQIECPPGRYQPLTGQNNCLIAPAGSFVDAYQAQTFTACPAGTYQPNAGSTDCEQTPAGQFSQEGATDSEVCTIGTYQPLEGQGLCLNASVGHYVSETGSINQVSCEKGYYQSDIGQINCNLSPAGAFVNMQGADNFTQCLPGTYQPLAGSIACIDAPINHFVNLEGAIEASVCPQGTSQPLTGQTECVSDTTTATTTNSETDTETQTEVETDSATQTEVETDSATQTEVETDSATQTEVETDSETQTEVETDSATQTEVETDSETQTEVETDSATQTEVETDSETQTEVETDSATQTEVETDSATQTEVETDSATQTEVETDSATQTEVEAGPQNSENEKLEDSAFGQITMFWLMSLMMLLGLFNSQNIRKS
ncbi:CAP domain-containing protein [Marinicellulosiphila megalodicopiae]|uniref:CAP domain-containing protein n=1 Tax=Marinicellulosiphila megalodicopiae TaxID=2724896 RepID=UPI003BB0F5AA